MLPMLIMNRDSVSVRSKMRGGCYLAHHGGHARLRVSVRSKMRRGCYLNAPDPVEAPAFPSAQRCGEAATRRLLARPSRREFPSAQRCGEAATPILGSSCSC